MLQGWKSLGFGGGNAKAKQRRKRIKTATGLGTGTWGARTQEMSLVKRLKVAQFWSDGVDRADIPGKSALLQNKKS